MKPEVSAWRRLRVLAAVVVASLVVGACPNGDGDEVGDPGGDRSEATREPEARGRADPDRVYAVGSVELDLVDTSRPTRAVGDAPGADERSLPTLVLYPSDEEPVEPGVVGDPIDAAPPARADAPFPLVVFSHGLRALAVSYEPFLLAAIAAQGYVVAAPTFPLTSAETPADAVDLLDVRNQPGDVSFVIDELLARTSGDPLEGMVDEARVGAAGHSLGAITTLLLGFHECCLDDRVDAAVSLAGRLALAPREGSWFPSEADAPLLFVHGEDDRLVAFRSGRHAFERAPVPKFFVTLLGGDHASPFLFRDTTWSDVVADSVVAFLDGHLEERESALDRLTTVAEVPGVSALESDRDDPNGTTP